MPGRPRPFPLAALVLVAGACTGEIIDGSTTDPPAVADRPVIAGRSGAPEGSLAPGTAGSSGAAPGSAPGAAAEAPRGFAPRRIWKLTPAQYGNTVRALLGADGSDFGALLGTSAASATEFSNGAEGGGLSLPQVERLWSSAADLAARAVRTPAALAPCLPTRIEDRACVQGFVAEFGARAFRRPLAPAEREAYLAFFEREAARRGRLVALEQVLRTMFLSPWFLYRTELGPEGASGPTVPLTDHERAAAISYFLSDGPPDAELTQAANQGRLRVRAELEAQARRLLASPAGGRGLARFFSEHLRADAVKTLKKDPKLFPAFTAQLAEQMARETATFVDQVLWKGDGRFRTLLTADHSYVSRGLAALYGLTSGGGSDFPRVTLPAGQRAGLLTQASFLAREAGERESDAVLRGVFIRKAFLCSPPPPPPPDVNAVPPPPDGKTTQRERLELHTRDPSCKGCHGLIDPLGLPLETYDAIGRHRTREANKPIDTSGAIVGTAASDGPVTDALDLADKLARSPDARACFARKLFRYAHGRAEGPEDAGWIADLARRFEASEGDVKDLAVQVIAADAFVTRAPGR